MPRVTITLMECLVHAGSHNAKPTERIADSGYRGHMPVSPSPGPKEGADA